MKNKDRGIEEIWNNMRDVPFDEDEDSCLCVSEDYHIFKKGTDREEIWHWFDKEHSKGVFYLLYEYNKELLKNGRL